MSLLRLSRRSPDIATVTSPPRPSGTSAVPSIWSVVPAPRASSLNGTCAPSSASCSSVPVERSSVTGSSPARPARCTLIGWPGRIVVMISSAASAAIGRACRRTASSPPVRRASSDAESRISRSVPPRMSSFASRRPARCSIMSATPSARSSAPASRSSALNSIDSSGDSPPRLAAARAASGTPPSLPAACEGGRRPSRMRAAKPTSASSMRPKITRSRPMPTSMSAMSMYAGMIGTSRRCAMPRASRAGRRARSVSSSGTWIMRAADRRRHHRAGRRPSAIACSA